MSLKSKILLEQSDWTRVSAANVKKFSHCKTKEVDGKFYYSPSSCKSKPPSKEKEKTEENDITKCTWKPSEGMYFKCNDGCGDTESGDNFRKYVNEEFPEISKKLKLSKKGTKTMSYCNSTMKDTWNYVYDSDNYPGLKGKTIGQIYSEGLKPEILDWNCEPWDTNNFFIRDYTTDDERDLAAWSMINSFNDEFKTILDAIYMDQCQSDIDNDLGWAEKNNKKDLHKNPVIKLVATKTPYGEPWYDTWKKRQTQKESFMIETIETKLKIKKKLKEMKNNKTISENVREKLKVSKIDKKINLKENSKLFFNQSYRKFFDNYYNNKVLNNLNESDLDDFDIAFNSVFGGHEETFIEKGIQFILNKLQIDPNSQIGKKITDTFKSLPKEEAKKMIDPQYVSETIVSILPESFVDISDPSGDGLETIVKNTIAKLAASRTTLDDLTHQISQKVKQSLEDLKNSTIETSSDMKKSYIEKLRNSI